MRRITRAAIARNAPDSASGTLHVDQPQVRLVDERRRLQCVPDTLPTDIAPSQPPQFVVHERHQLVERGLVATPPGFEQRGRIRSVVRDDPVYARFR